MFQALFGKRGFEQSTPSTLQSQKQRQIQSIRAIFFNELPPEFPHVAPILKVNPPVSHPLIEESTGTVTSVPGLTAFSIHTDLGKLISEVIQEFQANPPKQRNMFAPYGATNGIIPGSSSTPSQPPVPTYRCNAFPKLNELTNSELRSWLAQPDEIDRFVSELDEVTSLQQQRDEFILKNEEIAKSNLTKKELVEEKKHSLLEKVDEYHGLRRSFDEHSETFDLLIGRFKPEHLKDALRVRATEAEEESESTADQFLAGKMGPDAFLKQFMPTRTLSHMRRVKEEKLDNQLAQWHSRF